MDAKLRKQLMEMLVRYGIRGETDVEQVPFFPQKTDCFSTRIPESNTRCSTPEAEGVSSLVLSEMLQSFERHKAANLHTVSVFRHGKLISEATAKGYSTTTWRVTHSIAKTVTALAIGQLIDEGKLSLSDKVVDILADQCPPRLHRYTKDITVYHLLSMSAGVVGLSETTAVVEADWTKAFLESVPAFAPGTAFKYNSMNTYMLSVILHTVSGKTLSEWLGEKLFRPLGIANYLCEKGPEGIEKGGWGMYIAPRDMAKIGQLILQKGMWEGEQIVSEKWVSLMTKKAFSTGDSHGHFYYGLHIWVSPTERTYLMSGMLGQNVWICPETNVVAVLTAGNKEVFEKTEILQILDETLGDASKISKTPLKKDKKSYRTLRQTEADFWECHRFVTLLPKKNKCLRLLYRLLKKDPTPLPEEINAFKGCYRFRQNNAGILPLFCRFMQNNHTKGISRLLFLRKGNRFFVVFEEGEERHTVEVGFYQKALGQLNFKGEPYVIRAAGECGITEDGAPVLKIELLFPELSNTRYIKIYPEEGKLRLQLTESPGREMIEGMVAEFVPESLRAGGIMGFLRAKMFGVDPLTCIGPITEPVLYAEKE